MNIYIYVFVYLYEASVVLDGVFYGKRGHVQRHDADCGHPDVHPPNV